MTEERDKRNAEAQEYSRASEAKVSELRFLATQYAGQVTLHSS